jgi:hypothetical protein
MVVQLIVSDQRSPGPQVVRGPSLILRWPSPKKAESSGLEGMVTTTLPAYFRSQRQIIIDAEGLIAQRRRLTPTLSRAFHRHRRRPGDPARPLLPVPRR